MDSLIELIEDDPLFIGKGVDDQTIAEAENCLGVVFADEYRLFLRVFGSAISQGHELLGLGGTLDMVEATKEQRSLNPNVNSLWYVIERTGVDGAAIWQDKDGNLYQLVPGGKPLYQGASIADYISD